MQVQVTEAAFQRVLEIGISDTSCKTTLNHYCSFIKIIIKKTQTTHDIILSK